MKITARSEQEINELGLLSPGEYDFEVVEAKEEYSRKGGNEMLHLILSVWPNGRQEAVRIHDYLLDVPLKARAQKLRNFCLATGLDVAYRDGDLVGYMTVARSARCEVAIQKDKNGEYEDRNVVVDYMPGPVGIVAEPSPVTEGAGATRRDNIPF